MGDPRLRLLDAASGADADRFLNALDSVRPVIRVSSWAPVPVANAAATLLALLSRMFPHVEVDGSPRLGVNPWAAADLDDAAKNLQSVKAAPTTAPRRDITVLVGDGGSFDAGRSDGLGIGGGDWTARVGWHPQPFDLDVQDDRGHGLGLHAAACLAASELLKQVLTPLGMRALPLPGPGDAGGGQPLVWNLMDYRHREAAAVRQSVGAVAQARVVLAGVGSVGTSIAGMLSMVPGLSGELIAVDGEDFDPTRNPFRYPALAGREDGAKASWAADLLRRAGWHTDHHVGDIAAWATNRSGPGYDGLIVSSVDDLAGRFDVADLLARDVLSIGVAGLAFHLQWERLGDGFACPYCEYVPMEPPLSKAQVIANQVGLSVERAIALQLPGNLLTAEDLAACVASGRVSRSAAERLVGHRLADLIAHAYAEVAVAGSDAGNGTSTGIVALAAPHVSWLCGVLAAAEIVKRAQGLPLLDRRLDVDLSGLPQGFTRRVPADATGRCVCASGVRRRWMHKLYGI
jgi:hypothetical protein